MIHINVHEAKAKLSLYLEKARCGEIVVVCKRNVPVAEIRPITRSSRKPRPLGMAAQEHPDFELGEDFLEPLPEELAIAFEGGPE